MLGSFGSQLLIHTELKKQNQISSRECKVLKFSSLSNRRIWCRTASTYVLLHQHAIHFSFALFVNYCYFLTTAFKEVLRRMLLMHKYSCSYPPFTVSRATPFKSMWVTWQPYNRCEADFNVNCEVCQMPVLTKLRLRRSLMRSKNCKPFREILCWNFCGNVQFLASRHLHLTLCFHGFRVMGGSYFTNCDN